MASIARIVSNGLPMGTHVYDDRGEEVKHVISVSWRIDANGPAIVELEVRNGH